jgi:hypothetical protein
MNEWHSEGDFICYMVNSSYEKRKPIMFFVDSSSQHADWPYLEDRCFLHKKHAHFTF